MWQCSMHHEKLHFANQFKWEKTKDCEIFSRFSLNARTRLFMHVFFLCPRRAIIHQFELASVVMQLGVSDSLFFHHVDIVQIYGNFLWDFHLKIKEVFLLPLKKFPPRVNTSLKRDFFHVSRSVSLGDVSQSCAKISQNEILLSNWSVQFAVVSTTRTSKLEKLWPKFSAWKRNLLANSREQRAVRDQTETLKTTL